MYGGSGLKATTGSLVVSLQEVKAQAVEAKRKLKKSQKTVAASDVREKALSDKVTSLTEELLSVRVEHANLRADLGEMTDQNQHMKEDVEKSLSTVSFEVQKTYCDMADAGKRTIQEDHTERWKKMETRFQVESARLAVTARDELLKRS